MLPQAGLGYQEKIIRKMIIRIIKNYERRLEND
jgi:hypothetical protein